MLRKSGATRGHVCCFCRESFLGPERYGQADGEGRTRAVRYELYEARTQVQDLHQEGIEYEGPRYQAIAMARAVGCSDDQIRRRVRTSENRNESANVEYNDS